MSSASLTRRAVLARLAPVGAKRGIAYDATH
jgi:hypothetical protein